MKFFNNWSATFSKLILINILLLVTGIHSLSAQQLTITPGTSLVLNGSVSLVLNNAALQNNGAFAAGNSTVNFSGHNDTIISYVSGKNLTTFNNLSVSKTAYGIALKSSVAVTNVLTVSSGNLYTDSNLTLKSTVGLTARVAAVSSGSNIIGKANVERYINARRAWRLMTAPVANSNTIYSSWQNKGIYAMGQGTLVTGTNPSADNGLDKSTQNTSSMKGFNYSTQGFTKILNTNVAISSGSKGSADNTGYFIFIRGDRNPLNTNLSYYNATTLTSIGTLQTGTQTFAASPVSGAYSLIGNPYASPVNFDNITRTNVIKRFYVWDPTLNTVGGYVMMDDLNNTNVYTKSVSGSAQTKDIQSSQAFFVQTSGNGNATVVFNESSKSANNNNAVFRPLTATGNEIGNGQVRVSLNLLNADSTIIPADGAIAQFSNDFSAAVDLMDAAKFSNTNENLSIVRNNVLLSAERRPALSANDTIYLKLTTTTQRDYQFVFEADGLDQPGMVGFLEDSYLGTSTSISLSGATTVNFSVNAEAASASATRFAIVFKQATVVLPVKIIHFTAAEKNNGIQVDWKVENELNMVKYEVEKSADGVVFTLVNTTKVTGSGNGYNTYSWLDVKPAQGNNFYRIKSYDNSGEIKYSSIVKVTTGKATKTGSFNIYPNPVTGNVINIILSNQTGGKYQVRLTGVSGQSFLVKNIVIAAGNSNIVINTGSKPAAGVYQLEIIGSGNDRNTQQLIVE